MKQPVGLVAWSVIFVSEHMRQTTHSSSRSRSRRSRGYRGRHQNGVMIARMPRCPARASAWAERVLRRTRMAKPQATFRRTRMPGAL